MRFRKLKLLKPDYLEQYRKSLKIDLKKAFYAVSKEKHHEFGSFDYYLASSSTFSSNIEGNPISLDSFFKYATTKALKRTKNIKEIEDLIKTYKFARNNELTRKNFFHYSNWISIASGGVRKVFQRD